MKQFYCLFIAFGFLFAISFQINAQVTVLYDNGPLITNLSAGANGNHVSMMQNNTLGMNTIGFNSSFNFGYAVADDFTVPDSIVWYIDEFTVYGYQTGSTTASTMVAAYIRIWDGTPGEPGSTIIFGDTSTNRLNSTQFSGVYRTYQTLGFGNTDRPVMSNKIDAGILLGSGTYWIEYSLETASLASAWMPPVTILGQDSTGDGLQFTPDGYQPIIDGAGDPTVGTQTPQGVPFQVHGLIAEEIFLEESLVENVSCYDASDGSIFLMLSGGESPFTFLWSNGSTTEDLIGVAAGIYTVIVTDNIGQTLELEFEVEQPDELDWEVVALNDALCYGSDDGNVEIAVLGGTEPYTVQWDPNTEDQTGFTAVDLNAGTYFATITDDNGCTLAIAVEIGEADPLTPLTISGPTQVDEESETNYEVQDIEGWSYEWFVAGGNIVEGQGTHAITVLWASPGDGSVGIIAENSSGCETISSTGITIQEVVSVSNLFKNTTVTIHPNPVIDIVSISLSNDNPHHLQLFDINGKQLISQHFSAAAFQFSVEYLPAGTYILSLTNQANERYIETLVKQ